MRRLVIAAVLALALAGCGSESGQQPGGGTGPTTTEQPGQYDY